MRNEILNAIATEAAKPENFGMVSIPALVREFGPSTIAVLTQLRRERVVRWLAIGSPMYPQADLDLMPTQEGETFGAVEMR